MYFAAKTYNMLQWKVKDNTENSIWNVKCLNI